MKNKKWLALVLTMVLALSFGLTGCGKKSVKMDTDQYLNVLMRTARTFDYQKATDSSSNQIITMVFEGLTRVVNDGNGDIIEPGIAEKWECSEDGKVWTFHLRDAKWTDGQPVTAQQFRDGWIRLLDPKNAFAYASFIFDIVGAQEFNAGTGKAEDVKIEAKDEKTLVVTLKSPVPYFIQITPFKNLYPVRLDIVEANGDTYGTDPMKMVFNGPFVIKEFVKGSKILFEKNPTFWDADKVKLQKINMIYVEEEASSHQMFQAKQLDVIAARGDYAKKYFGMVEQKQMTVRTGAAPSTGYVIFNCQTGGANKLFTNAKIRLAFGLALDREDYVNNLSKRGTVAYGFVPPTLMIGEKDYRKEVEEPYKKLVDEKKDVKALFKEGLQELGLATDGTYTVKYLDNGTDSLSKLYQEWYKQQWESKLGVKVELVIAADEAQYWEMADRMEFDVVTYGWTGDFNDPETFFNLFTPGNENNPGKWTSKEYDDLYAKSKSTADNNERLELFKQMEEILLVKEAAIAPISYSDMQNFRQSYVKNVMCTMFGPAYEYKYAYTEGRQ